MPVSHFARRVLTLARCGWHAGWFMRTVRFGPIVCRPRNAVAVPECSLMAEQPAKTRTRALFSVSGVYVLGAINTNSCPVASEQITSEAQCLLATAALSLVAASPMASSYATYPKGCYLYSYGSTRVVYFNPHPTGAARSDSTSTPICGPAPSAGAPLS